MPTHLYPGFKPGLTQAAALNNKVQQSRLLVPSSNFSAAMMAAFLCKQELDKGHKVWYRYVKADNIQMVKTDNRLDFERHYSYKKQL
jgi:hypothetical protein